LKNNNYHSLKLPLDESFPSIVLKPWRADPGLEPGRVEEKIGKEKTQLTRQDQVKNPVVTR
jgi:hypothetical protein